MNKRLTKKLLKKAIQPKANTQKTKGPVINTATSGPAQKDITDQVFVTRNSHPDYPYALLDQNYNFITNLLKLSEARIYCKQEFPQKKLDVVRNLDHIYEIITA